MSEFDIIVAGRGPAGLATACLLAGDGWRLALIGQRQVGDDPRTVALMQPSIRLLETIGLWPGTLRQATVPLKRLRIVDDTQSAVSAPELIFDSAEIGEEAFGWNIPLSLLIPALEERARQLGIAMLEAEVTGADPGGSDVALRTSAGPALSARLIVAADGRGSILRDAAGIGTNAWSYDQVALATSFAHSGNHQNISTEYHRAAGPCTTVPMPDGRSALVWMERPARAAELMALSGQDLAREVQLAIHGELGLVSDIGRRRAFAMQGLVARQFAAHRIMLVGEAAHVVPPIGAQGLNMSLRDAAFAADHVQGADDPGAPAHLAHYDRIRRRDIQPRQQVIDLMNRSLLSGYLALAGGRTLGLSLVANFPPLRRYIMKQGVGTGLDLPPSMHKPQHGIAP